MTNAKLSLIKRSYLTKFYNNIREWSVEDGLHDLEIISENMISNVDNDGLKKRVKDVFRKSRKEGPLRKEHVHLQ